MNKNSLPIMNFVSPEKAVEIVATVAAGLLASGHFSEPVEVPGGGLSLLPRHESEFCRLKVTDAAVAVIDDIWRAFAAVQKSRSKPSSQSQDV